MLRRARQGQGGSVAASNVSNVIALGDLSIDFSRRQAFRSGEHIRLNIMEFNLLELLIGRAGEPINCLDMLEKVWGYKPERSSDSRVVDVHISRLRTKLETHPKTLN